MERSLDSYISKNNKFVRSSSGFWSKTKSLKGKDARLAIDNSGKVDARAIIKQKQIPDLRSRIGVESKSSVETTPRVNAGKIIKPIRQRGLVSGSKQRLMQANTVATRTLKIQIQQAVAEQPRRPVRQVPSTRDDNILQSRLRKGVFTNRSESLVIKKDFTPSQPSYLDRTSDDVLEISVSGSPVKGLSTRSREINTPLHSNSGFIDLTGSAASRLHRTIDQPPATSAHMDEYQPAPKLTRTVRQQPVQLETPPTRPAMSKTISNRSAISKTISNRPAISQSVSTRPVMNKPYSRPATMRSDDIVKREQTRIIQSKTPTRAPVSSKPALTIKKTTPTVTLTKIVVTNLVDVTEDDIYELFSDIGPIESSRLVGPGRAVVMYKTPSDAQAAVDAYNDRELDGVAMSVRIIGQVPERTTAKPVLSPKTGRTPEQEDRYEETSGPLFGSSRRTSSGGRGDADNMDGIRSLFTRAITKSTLFG